MADKRKKTDSGTESAQGLWGTISTFFWAVVIALVVRTFAFEPFSIPSGSMYPGLLIGDYLFVSKYSYGYSRYSFPWSPNIVEDRILDSPARRGDVVVFRVPHDTKVDYIKRIVGLPGDRIQLKGGVLHINGKPAERKVVNERFVVAPGEPARRLIEERLPDSARPHRILESDYRGQGPNTQEYVVPAGHYFLMGDNRDNSIDSRELCTGNRARDIANKCVGYVPARNLVGKAQFLFFSSDGSAHIWEVWKWPGAIRWNRLLNGVE